jgi:NADH dehydrogenase FAD-containing subunit
VRVLNEPVEGVDIARRCVFTSEGEHEYDMLVIASGFDGGDLP